MKTKEIKFITHRKDQAVEEYHVPPTVVLELFQANLQSMRDWYKKQEGHGQELGHFVVMEISLGNVIVALSDALEGKTWLHPK